MASNLLWNLSFIVVSLMFILVFAGIIAKDYLLLISLVIVIIAIVKVDKVDE